MEARNIERDVFGQRKRPKRTVELYFEIIESEILPRLPARSSIRCKCVCKQWKSFISTHKFARMNLCHITNDQYLTHSKLIEISCSSQTFTSRDCEDLKNQDSTTVRPIPFATGGDEVFIVVGSLDGLVCVFLEITCELVIWNPLTSAYKKLSKLNAPPFYRRHCDAIGFYFDSSNNDTKVDDGDCWTKVAVFFRAQHSPLRFNNFYVSRNGNTLVILDNNNVFYKMDMEDLATNFYVNFTIWHHDKEHSIYRETLVSPNP